MQKVDEATLAAAAVAPRVTEEMVKDNIAAVNYFTAADGVNMTDAPTHPAHRLLTFCIIVLKNGFTVTGESACASPANFNKEIGESIAYQQAFNKIWALMGYELRTKLVMRQAQRDSVLVPRHPSAETYVGTKVVHGIPMTRGEYNSIRGWTLPEGEDGMDEGYLVEYTDVVQPVPLVPGFLGYVSWSPKAVFKRAYEKL